MSTNHTKRDAGGPSARDRQVAVALGYAEDLDAAPKVLAKGQGTVADRILELAKAHEVPVRSDPDLVQSLAKLDVGEMIPPDLYPAVAEVLAWVYRMNQSKRRQRGLA